jgi:beta-glucuronidase
MGFVVLAETPNGNFRKLHFEDRDILANTVNQTKEMLKYYKNETCIIFWNLFMESETNEPAAINFIPGYIKLVKDTDPSRLTIHASLIPLNDPVAAYFDVIGINYWSGWYYGETIEEGSAYLDKIGAKYPDKPVVITSGGWEGIYGFHSYNRNEKWSEEDQAKYLTEVSRMYISKDYTVGEIIWTFNDFRVSPWVLANSGRWALRPMELNHKGVVDYFRRPKLSYFAMQKVFKEWDDKK